jgi:hypothetical protein
MKAGKYPSVRAAAKAAGILKEATGLDLLNQESKDPKTIAEKVQPLAEHGEDRKSEEKENQPTASRLKTYGSTKEYRAARLARDAPDVLERMKAGQSPRMVVPSLLCFNLLTEHGAEIFCSIPQNRREFSSNPII